MPCLDAVFSGGPQFLCTRYRLCVFLSSLTVLVFVLVVIFTTRAYTVHENGCKSEPHQKTHRVQRMTGNQLEFTDVSDISMLLEHISQVQEVQRIQHAGNDSTHRVMWHELNLLSRALGVEDWRRQLVRNLSSTIRNRLTLLQNPSKCVESEKLFCNLNNPAGVASGAHDVLWCALNAYLGGKMLVLNAKGWHLSPQGWETFFQPVTASCPQEAKLEHTSPWPGRCDDDHRHPLVHLPDDIERDLRLVGSNPLPWWYGQLLGNFLKPSRELEDRIAKTMLLLNFTKPIVGIHIRRTDKIGTEGSFHAVKEYMRQVENYYDNLEFSGQRLTERKVFIAADDPNAIQECKTRYPGYTFLYNERSAKMAVDLDTRYEHESVREALLDLYLLARSDYLVCTFSSGFSRLAYELLLYYNPEGINQVYSLDTEYFYAGAANPPRLAMYNHSGEGQMTFVKGDLLGQPYYTSLQSDATFGKVYDGYSTGVNFRTKEVGTYPIYKTSLVFTISKTNGKSAA